MWTGGNFPRCAYQVSIWECENRGNVGSGAAPDESAYGRRKRTHAAIASIRRICAVFRACHRWREVRYTPHRMKLDTTATTSRRRLLRAFVNTTVALVGGALAGVLGRFEVVPRATAEEQWIRA